MWIVLSLTVCTIDENYWKLVATGYELIIDCDSSNAIQLSRGRKSTEWYFMIRSVMLIFTPCPVNVKINASCLSTLLISSLRTECRPIAVIDLLWERNTTRSPRATLVHNNSISPQFASCQFASNQFYIKFIIS